MIPLDDAKEQFKCMKPGTFQNIYKEMNRKNTILKTPWYGTFKFGFSIFTI